MAYTKRHAIKATVKKALEYVLNKEKTENGVLVYGLNCSINSNLATKQMEHTREYYGKNKGNLAFHFVQSFKPGEIKDYRTAYEIGIKLAERITEGKYQAVVTTHTDQEHIHNHIIINSVSHIDGRKYNSCKAEYEHLKNLSNEITREYNLSVIEPKGKGKSYKEWQENKKGTSWKAKIKNDIDTLINEVKTFEQLIEKLNEKGYEIKFGKYIAFKCKGQQRFSRGKTIGEDYTEEAIKRRIEEKKYSIETYKYKPKNVFVDKRDIYKYKYKKASLVNNISLTILLIKTLLNKDSGKKKINKKYVSRYGDTTLRKLETALSLVGNENIKSMEDIKSKMASINNKIDKIDELILKLENLDTKMEVIKDNIDTLNKYKVFNDEYKSSKFKFAYELKHKEQINKFNNSKEILETIGIKNDTDIKELLEEYKANKTKIKDYKERRNNIVKEKEKFEDLFRTIDKVYKKEYVKTIKENIDKENLKNQNKNKESKKER